MKVVMEAKGKKFAVPTGVGTQDQIPDLFSGEVVRAAAPQQAPGRSKRRPRTPGWTRPRSRKLMAEMQLVLPLYNELPELKPAREPDWVTDAREWREEEWVVLHGALLDRSLEDLANPRIGKAIYEDIISWVTAPIDVHRIPRAFSFQACAQLFSLDPEELQSLTLKNVQETNEKLAKRRVSLLREHIQTVLEGLGG